ncbi:uncharacterized protein LOC131634318 [Vicia villosa]|uniref:uncharacterized protein LOC131634318 n=1 Tax=Vicia villosa TaxID=3911 RepID=UPI00273BB287|nr:uncharacterized protein LOC131634318 [Vicia villosa]
MELNAGLIKTAAQNNKIHGVQVARKAPCISHLFCLLFFCANSAEADCVLEILKTYQESSGQMVNMEKSEVSFSQNVRDEDRNLIRNRMCVKTVDRHSKYLGLPVIFGRSKKEIFAMGVERVWKKMKGWKEKVSITGGERSLNQSHCSGDPKLCDELLQTA